MISKETFCTLLKSCKSLWEYSRKLRDVGINLDDDHICYKLLDNIIFALDDEFDGDSVSYYFFERECNGMEMNGKSTPFLWEEDGTEVWIHSDEELYEYLVSTANKDDITVIKIED